MVATPRIKPVSQMTDPTALPMASAGLPWSAASTETTASGRVVPRLTIVAPIRTLGMPHRTERVTASSTRRSAPLQRM